MEFIDLHTLAAVTPNAISYRQAAAEVTGLRNPPRFVFGPVPRQFGEWYFGDRQAPRVGVFSLGDVTFTGDRMLSWQDKYLCIPQNGIHLGVQQGFETIKTIRHIDETVAVLTGPAYQMYGHWLIDFQPRLYALIALGYDISELRYLMPGNIMDFSRAWLDALGINASQIIFYDPLTEQCQISRILIPTCLRGNGRASPLFAPAMHDFKSRLGIDTHGTATTRVFASRKKWNNESRKLINIEEVENAFEKNGFKIIYPEEMNIFDQVRIFSECQILAAEYGSALHNSIFSSTGTMVIALRGTEGHPGFLQSGLCEAFGQDCGYIFGKTDMAGDNQLYTIERSDLDLCLDLICNS